MSDVGCQVKCVSVFQRFHSEALSPRKIDETLATMVNAEKVHLEHVVTLSSCDFLRSVLAVKTVKLEHTPNLSGEILVRALKFVRLNLLEVLHLNGVPHLSQKQIFKIVQKAPRLIELDVGQTAEISPKYGSLIVASCKLLRKIDFKVPKGSEASWIVELRKWCPRIVILGFYADGVLFPETSGSEGYSSE